MKALTAQRARRKESVWEQTDVYALGTEDRMDMRLGHTRGACDSENPVLIIVNVRVDVSLFVSGIRECHAHPRQRRPHIPRAPLPDLVLKKCLGGFNFSWFEV